MGESMFLKTSGSTYRVKNKPAPIPALEATRKQINKQSLHCWRRQSFGSEEADSSFDSAVPCSLCVKPIVAYAASFPQHAPDE